jgi:hypothetical protein
MSEKQDEAKNQPKNGLDYWWDNGLKLFVQLSGWLVAPLVFSLYFGRWLDDRYQTDPWLFLLSVGLAFTVTCAGIVFETMKFIKAIEKDVKNPKSQLPMPNQDQNPKSKL